MIKKESDEDRVEDPLPRGHCRQLGAVGVDGVPVELAAADVDVDVARAQPGLALPGEADEPEEDDDGEREVRFEEALGVIEPALRGTDGDVELFLFASQNLRFRMDENTSRGLQKKSWTCR